MDEFPLNISFAICHRSELCADNKVSLAIFLTIGVSFHILDRNEKTTSFTMFRRLFFLLYYPIHRLAIHWRNVLINTLGCHFPIS
jgi:hypothetical protein